MTSDFDDGERRVDLTGPGDPSTAIEFTARVYGPEVLFEAPGVYDGFAGKRGQA
jgi:hypothetical protein